MRFRDAMVIKGLATSNSAADRLIKQHAVSMKFQDKDWYPIDDTRLELLEPFPAFLLRVGRRQIEVAGVQDADGSYMQIIPMEKIC